MSFSTLNIGFPGLVRKGTNERAPMEGHCVEAVVLVARPPFVTRKYDFSGGKRAI